MDNQRAKLKQLMLEQKLKLVKEKSVEEDKPRREIKVVKELSNIDK